MCLLSYTAPNEGKELNLQGMVTTSCSQYPADYLLSSMFLSIYSFMERLKMGNVSVASRKFLRNFMKCSMGYVDFVALKQGKFFLSC